MLRRMPGIEFQSAVALWVVVYTQKIKFVNAFFEKFLEGDSQWPGTGISAEGKVSLYCLEWSVPAQKEKNKFGDLQINKNGI